MSEMTQMSESEHPQVDHAQVADAVNAAVNYTMYSVFRTAESGVGSASAVLARLDAIEALATRGWYDVAGFRADADILVWWHAERPETLQEAYRAVVEGSAGGLAPVWSNVGVHRTAEFNRQHVPAFLAGDEAKGYVCVYPFVRSYEWYLLPEAERSQLLREHGAAARDYGDVLANTTSAFALGDYEWLLAFESDDLLRIVDLMRDLRATGARRHVREEVPFFTGPRVAAEVLLGRALGA